MDEGSPSNGGQVFGASWRPKGFSFGPYLVQKDAPSLRVVVRKPLVVRLTKDIVETYQICNPLFKYSEELNPKRYLTSPSVGVLNDGYDNVNSDLILAVNLVLVNAETQRRYIVKDLLGHGTFGQVAKCWDAETNSFVAVKIIKNQPAYYQQALVELNKKYDREDKHHIVRIYEYFVCQRHLCICFELLDSNLYELIKINHFRGLSLSIVQLFSKQILRGLSLLKDAGIIHCDLKPENILLCTRAQPPDYVLKEAKNTSKFFKCIGSVHNIENGEVSIGGRSAYQALTEIEYEARELKKPLIGKEYFHHKHLEEIVTNYPYRKNLSMEDISKESQIRLALVDFLKGLVEFDPAKRWSPFQASRHPFVTGEPFTCPYQPPPETPRVPVAQNFKVDHHPGAGHWFAAGLSPNISGRSKFSMHNSPHFQVVPYGYGNSYGSVGSYGSYNDGTGLGSSYGSYGDGGNTFAYFSPVGPSGMNLHAQSGVSVRGSSPDARKRFIQYSQGNGLGVSPSAGMFVPLPLGTSPSQFTPPSSYGQVSSGSPGHYGPTSPARSSCHGSPLGKMTAATHYNRRKNWGYSGNPQSQESPSSQHWQGQFIDGANSGQAEWNPQVLGSASLHLPSNPSATSSKQQRGGSGIAASYSAMPNMPSSLTRGPAIAEAAHDKPETSLSVPDPGDWDPNYSELQGAMTMSIDHVHYLGHSDEQLLQEDGSDEGSITTEFSKAMHLSSADSSVGVGRFNRTSSTSSNIPIQRQNGPIQAFSHIEVGSPPASHEPQAGHSRFMSKPSHLMPHISQNSPSRLGQPPLQRYNLMRTTAPQGSEWNQFKIQPPPSGFNSGGPRSPGNSSFNNGMPWGIFLRLDTIKSLNPSAFTSIVSARRRANHPVSNIPPASRGRKDYGRIV
ncbi:Dual specificity protein kinase YAK1-like [Citrus sinensis]|uniref:Dual specificity protein kinase YAK1-like n=1 Tax=Citrus sinensis TaxID=2711 RepID=A0ACB8LD38_CITSI|nr:Dual specificity protein kinase YAK1-like [Citrus sinensis]